MAALDTKLFRQVMGHFATGVTVITTRRGDEKHGMTANAVCSVSLDPLLILVCIDKKAHMHRYLQTTDIFAVNILTEDQEALSRWFANDDRIYAPDPFGGTPHHTGVTGAPLIDGCIAHLDCRVAGRYDAGDHTIFLGKVEAAKIDGERRPLLFYKGRYARLP